MTKTSARENDKVEFSKFSMYFCRMKKPGSKLSPREGQSSPADCECLQLL